MKHRVATIYYSYPRELWATVIVGILIGIVLHHVRTGTFEMLVDTVMAIIIVGVVSFLVVCIVGFAWYFILTALPEDPRKQKAEEVELDETDEEWRR